MEERSIPTRLAVVATLLAAFAAAAGLVVAGLYRDAPNWVQQAQGTDLATLFIAVPVLVVGLWTAGRGSATGRIAMVAGLLYLVYNYAIFAFSVAMNPLTAVHLAIFGVSLWSLLLGAQTAVDAGEAATERLDRRASAWLLIVVAGMFGLLWIGQIATTTVTGALAPDLVRAGISSNPVYALDLAFFLPLCAIAGVGLLRGNRAAAFALPMLIWVPLMGAGVLGGFVLAALTGAEVPIVVAAVIGTLCLASTSLAGISIVRPPARAADPTHRAGRAPAPPTSEVETMFVIERLIAAAGLFVAAHFAMGYLNPSAGGTGGALLFPFANDAGSRWAFGSLDGGPLVLLIPLMIGLAGIAVLAFFFAVLATFGVFVPTNLWRPLVLVGVACSVTLLVLHPSVWVLLPLALNAGLAWVAWTSAWTPSAA